VSDDSPPYEIRFTEDAGAETKKLDGSVRQRFRKTLENKIAIKPDEYGTPLRAPLEGFWKHEFASHRVVYRIYEERRLVVICAVGPRKEGDVADIYRKLEAAEKAGKLAQQAREALDKYLRGRK
jgi:mRNA-degrading endonuclease RelE of RelBE toxin-antitoxin system